MYNKKNKIYQHMYCHGWLTIYTVIHMFTFTISLKQARIILELVAFQLKLSKLKKYTTLKLE